MESLALTRASTLGPIVDHIRRGGGSIRPLFKAADIPLELIDRPTALLPLRDHFKIVELAARELDDAALPARLALAAGVGGLGAFGSRFLAASDLRSGIENGNRMFTSMLQSGTRMTLTTHGSSAKWTYEVLERPSLGRQKNEVLALGYMTDMLRRFAGPTWSPDRVQVPGALDARAQIESLLRCEIETGSLLSMSFPRYWLDAPGLRGNPAATAPGHCELPDWSDLHGAIRELIRLGLLGGQRPARGWVAAHLGLSVRTMQRRLHQHQVNFAQVLRETVLGQALEMLREGRSITAIAIDLGYSDPGHFTRAFRRRFDVSPREWRSSQA